MDTLPFWKGTHMCYCTNDRHKRGGEHITWGYIIELVCLTPSYHKTFVLTNVWLLKRPAHHYFSNIKVKNGIWYLNGIRYHKDHFSSLKLVIDETEMTSTVQDIVYIYFLCAFVKWLYCCARCVDVVLLCNWKDAECWLDTMQCYILSLNERNTLISLKSFQNCFLIPLRSWHDGIFSTWWQTASHVLFIQKNCGVILLKKGNIFWFLVLCSCGRSWTKFYSWFWYYQLQTLLP